MRRVQGGDRAAPALPQVGGVRASVCKPGGDRSAIGGPRSGSELDGGAPAGPPRVRGPIGRRGRALGLGHVMTGRAGGVYGLSRLRPAWGVPVGRAGTVLGGWTILRYHGISCRVLLSDRPMVTM